MMWMESLDMSCKPFTMFTNSTCMDAISHVINISSGAATDIAMKVTEFNDACQALTSKVRTLWACCMHCVELVGVR
jgi:hypothetical protein